MKLCQKCGKEIIEEADVCPNCGCIPEIRVFTTHEEDEISIELCMLAAFVPLIGIIYWPVKHKKTPKRAMACGITGIVSWAIFSILMNL